MRTFTIAALLVLVGSWAVFADGVLRRSDVARGHMRELLRAFYEYETDQQQIPTDPRLLYPQHVPNARTFWHPGDSNPPPWTIDNSLPNARNSAKISFDWNLDSYWRPDTLFLRDNSPANNAGRFVNFLTYDGVIETDPPLATPTPTRDALARAHLGRIARAMHIYSNENEEWYPTDLKQLWDGGYLASPRSAWNPGDSDPMPIAITNSVPNATDSAQISFEYLLTGKPPRTVDELILRDNSPANNGGQFIYMMTNDLVIETDPPNASPVPTQISLARAHLRRFFMPLWFAAYYNDGYLPADLLQVWNPFILASPRTFWNPGDADPLPTDITNSVPNGPNSTQVSFEYLGAGLNLWELPPEFVLLRDNTIENNGGYGINVVRADGRIEFVPDCPGDVDGNKRVNWRDLVILLAHLGTEEGATPHQGDINGNGAVDNEDLQILAEHFGDVCAQLALPEPSQLAP